MPDASAKETYDDLMDAKVNALVNSVPAVTETAVDDVIVNNLISDIAQAIHPPDEIAARYGLTGEGLLRVLAIPEVRRRTKERRALWESGESVQTRARTYAGHLVIEAMPEIDRMIHSPVTPPSSKLDAVKLAARVAGLDAVVRANPGDTTSGTAPFSVNIMFSSGESARITTVGPPAEIEGEAA